MRIKERHISGAFVDVQGDDFDQMRRFVDDWRKAVDDKTTVELEDEAAEKPDPEPKDVYGAGTIFLDGSRNDADLRRRYTTGGSPTVQHRIGFHA